MLLHMVHERPRPYHDTVFMWIYFGAEGAPPYSPTQRGRIGMCLSAPSVSQQPVLSVVSFSIIICMHYEQAQITPTVRLPQICSDAGTGRT